MENLKKEKLLKIASKSKIQYMDGVRLNRAITSGIRYLISRQDYLNKINVFPVPDGDTGTNMAFTMTSVLEASIEQIEPKVDVFTKRLIEPLIGLIINLPNLDKLGLFGDVDPSSGMQAGSFGAFLGEIINYTIIAFVMFLVIKAYYHFEDMVDDEEEESVVANSVPKFDYEELDIAISEDTTHSYFGYEYFVDKDKLLNIDNIPVPNSYVLGPGDEIVISIWGKVQT